MSFFPGKDPAAGDKFQCDAIKALIVYVYSFGGGEK